MTQVPTGAEIDALSGISSLPDAIDQTPNLVAMFDVDDKLVFANLAFRQAYGLDSSQDWVWRSIIMHAYSLSCGPVIETDSISDWLTRADARRGTLPFRGFEADFHDGRWFFITETMHDNGNLLLIGVDISAVKAEGRVLRTQRDKALRDAWTDPLTGLANRRYCLDQLKAWHEKPGDGTQGALAIIDLDHFKQVNDLFGHAFGDRVLVDFGQFVLDRIRLPDLFGRIGGEEFLLFMPGCALSMARTRIENLILELGGRSAMNDQEDFRYSFSCGLASLTRELSFEVVLNLADDLLYQAKLAGRGCIVTSSLLV